MAAAQDTQYLAKVERDEKCCVCLDNIGGAIFLSECKHAFHFGCIQQHVVRNGPNCPMCRAVWTSAPGMSTTSLPSMRERAAWTPRPDLQPVESEQQARALRPDWVTTTIMPSLSAMPAGVPTEACALVRLEASDIYDTAPADFVLLADVSGSMAGAKLEAVKESLKRAAGIFREGDRVALVSFDHRVTQEMPLTPMSEAGRDALRTAADALTVRGGTDIKRALRAAFAVVSSRRTVRQVCHVLLLTDGEDLRAKSSIDEAMSEARGCVVSCMGYGADHDVELLSKVAEMGRGSYTSVPNAEAFGPVFGGYLGDATSVAAANAVTLVKPGAPWVTIQEVAGSGKTEAVEDGGWKHELEYVLAGTTRDVLVRMSVTPPEGFGGDFELISATTEARAVGGTRFTTEPEAARISIGHKSDSVCRAEVDAAMDRHLLAVAAREAVTAMHGGDTERARTVLAATAGMLRTPQAEEEIRTMDFATTEFGGLATLSTIESAYRNQQSFSLTPSVRVSARASRLAGVVSGAEELGR